MALIEMTEENGTVHNIAVTDRELRFLWHIVCDVIAINEPGALEPES